MQQVDEAVSLALQKVNHATMLVNKWDERTLDRAEVLSLLALSEDLQVYTKRANAAASEWNTNNAHKAEEESLYNLFWSKLQEKPAGFVRVAVFSVRISACSDRTCPCLVLGLRALLPRNRRFCHSSV